MHARRTTNHRVVRIYLSTERRFSDGFLAIPLSGTGVNGPFLTPYPNRVNFMPQAVGTSSTPTPVLLVNTGKASMNITGIGITGADSSDFAQINNCGSSLPAAGNCTAKVTLLRRLPGLARPASQLAIRHPAVRKRPAWREPHWGLLLT